MSNQAHYGGSNPFSVDGGMHGVTDTEAVAVENGIRKNGIEVTRDATDKTKLTVRTTEKNDGLDYGETFLLDDGNGHKETVEVIHTGMCEKYGDLVDSEGNPVTVRKPLANLDEQTEIVFQDHGTGNPYVAVQELDPEIGHRLGGAKSRVVGVHYTNDDDALFFARRGYPVFEIGEPTPPPEQLDGTAAAYAIKKLDDGSVVEEQIMPTTEIQNLKDEGFTQIKITNANGVSNTYDLDDTRVTEGSDNPYFLAYGATADENGNVTLQSMRAVNDDDAVFFASHGYPTIEITG